MYDTNKQSKNGIVVSYKHIVPENKNHQNRDKKKYRELYSILFLNSCKAVQEQSDCSDR